MTAASRNGGDTCSCAVPPRAIRAPRWGGKSWRKVNGGSGVKAALLGSRLRGFASCAPDEPWGGGWEDLGEQLVPARGAEGNFRREAEPEPPAEEEPPRRLDVAPPGSQRPHKAHQ